MLRLRKKPAFIDRKISEKNRAAQNASAAAATRDSAILIRLEADFASDGKYGQRVLEVTSDEVRVLEWDDVASFRIPISDIKSARNEPLVGGGRLEISTKDGEILPVLSYSQSVAAKFS